ncbi:hypothetical protein [Desulfovirgula thermocuniculi]|uniref:hypothetical protein n=1 Tax=Desulfovirgula thermocuniculi TaxID=348842 RepID=UPI0003F9FA65|nr:hypothetical protein [Desulfovirgula thermocuniculi]
MPFVSCDPEKEQGAVFSSNALAVLDFLESCRGAPEGAVALLFPRHYRDSLRILRGAGFARRCWMPNHDPFWCPASAKPPATVEEYRERSALGWLAARLLEAGARLEGNRAVFPSGRSFQVVVWRGSGSVPNGCLAVCLGDVPPPPGAELWVFAKDLPERRLKECLYRRR